MLTRTMSAPTDEKLLRTKSVARILDLTPTRVRQLDDELQPLFTEDGARLYRRADVERVAAMRAGASAARRPR